MKQIILEKLTSFLGEDFSNKDHILGIPLKHKGLVEPRETRYYGGRKVRKEFQLQDGSVAVSIDFEDVKKDGDNFVVVSSLDDATHIKKHCKYYYDDGTIYCEKTEHELIKNKKKLAKSRIQYAIDYLVDTAEKLGASSAVAFIFEGFKKGFESWRDLANSDVFINQLNGDDTGITVNTQQLYATVNAPIPNFAPKTFKDALIEQLTSKKWQPN